MRDPGPLPAPLPCPLKPPLLLPAAGSRSRSTGPSPRRCSQSSPGPCPSSQTTSSDSPRRCTPRPLSARASTSPLAGSSRRLFSYCLANGQVAHRPPAQRGLGMGVWGEGSDCQRERRRPPPTPTIVRFSLLGCFAGSWGRSICATHSALRSIWWGGGDAPCFSRQAAVSGFWYIACYTQQSRSDQRSRTRRPAHLRVGSAPLRLGRRSANLFSKAWQLASSEFAQTARPWSSTARAPETKQPTGSRRPMGMIRILKAMDPYGRWLSCAVSPMASSGRQACAPAVRL